MKNYQPFQHTRLLVLHNNNKNGCVHINKKQRHSNSGQDFRKYSGIDANDNNCYYHVCWILMIHIQQTTSILNSFKLYVAIDFNRWHCN